MSAAAVSAAVRPTSPRRRLVARCILLPDGGELSPGEVHWDRLGRIVALRRAHRVRGKIEDVCVLPGLVDAHTHLQLDPLEATAPRDFVPWAGAVMAAGAQRTLAELHGAARTAALARCVEGVTAVGEIDSSGESPRALMSTGIAGRCYRELTGYHLDARGARELIAKRRHPGTVALRAGLSPHAPYSVAADLFRGAAAANRHLAIHCAETAAEQQFLRQGTGPFADLLRRLNRLPPGARPAGVGAVRWLEQLGLLRATTQLVHCQELEEGDIGRIAAARAPVVVCPGTIDWFRRDPPPVDRWLAAGVTVALGTDSRASNASWSMRATMAAATRLWPGLSPVMIVAMATQAGGRALGCVGLGSLRRGGRADLLALPATSDRAVDHLAAFVHGESKPNYVLVRGRRLDAPYRR